MSPEEAISKTLYIEHYIRFELLKRVCDACRIKLRAQVIQRDDIPRDGGKRTGGHTDQHLLPRYRRLKHLFRTHYAAFFLLLIKCINDLFVNGEHDGISRVPVRVRLYGYDARGVEVSLMHELTRRFGDKRQDEDTEHRENPLEQRRETLRPRAIPLPRPQHNPSSDKRANVVKIIQQTHAPRAPSARKGLREIYAARDAAQRGTDTEDYSCYNEHSDMLRCGLEEYDEEGDD